jgi:hypothetical protein
MKLKSRDIAQTDLHGIGRLLFSPTDPKVKPGDECSFAIIQEDLGLTDASCAGTMDCAPRPMQVSRMERHLHTPEILVAIDGDSVICLAPPQEPVAGKLKDMRAVRVKTGQVFILDTGAWHWIPFPLAPQPARFLVIFKEKTGQNDLQFHALAESVSIDA